MSSVDFGTQRYRDIADSIYGQVDKYIHVQTQS